MVMPVDLPYILIIIIITIIYFNFILTCVLMVLPADLSVMTFMMNY